MARGRKRRGRAGRPSAQRDAPAARPSEGVAQTRSERRDAEARAALEPLAEGERPRAVTVGAVVAVVAAVLNLASHLPPLELGPPLGAWDVGLSMILVVTAVGQWQRRYWAVLGMETFLGIIIVWNSLVALLLLSWRGLLVFVVVVLPAGTLFWFLVKAMARIQMPTRA